MVRLLCAATRSTCTQTDTPLRTGTPLTPSYCAPVITQTKTWSQVPSSLTHAESQASKVLSHCLQALQLVSSSAPQARTLVALERTVARVAQTMRSTSAAGVAGRSFGVVIFTSMSKPTHSGTPCR